MTSTQVYFCEFCNIFKNIFLIEYLETNASGMSRIYYLANLIHLKRTDLINKKEQIALEKNHIYRILI